MKNITRKLTLAAALAVLAALTFGLLPSASGQTNTNTATAATSTNAPSISGGLTEIWNAIDSSGLTTATNYAVEPYLTYAPNAPGGNKIGGGVFAAYNVNKFLGTGLGFDYLGQLSLVSANVQLKVATHPLSFLGTGWATNLVVAPFALAGVGTGLSGSTGGAIAVTDAGAYVQFGELWGGRFNVGAAAGRWDNAGAYSGQRYHLFAGWSKGF
jgi:hypothetical protein